VVNVSEAPWNAETSDTAERYLSLCGHGLLAASHLLALKVAGERLTHAEWERVADLALPHRMGPLVFHHTAHAGLLAVIPEATKEVLKAAYCSSLVVNRTLHIALDKILVAFAAQGIETIPLKGVMLAERYYPALALRPASDIDLLVRPDDVPAAMRALAALGYLPRAGSESLTGKHALRFLELQLSQPNGPSIELHTTLARIPSYRGSLPLTKIWDRSRVEQVGGQRVLCLALQDELRYLSLHYAAQHRDARLFWLVDIVQVVKALPRAWSWNAFVIETTQCGLAMPVAKTLQDATNALGLDLPDDVLARLWTAASAASERTAWKLASAEFAAPARVSRHLLALPGLRAKLAFAGEIFDHITRVVIFRVHSAMR
jgi:putative nucleotidyltransferase-like protein